MPTDNYDKLSSLEDRIGYSFNDRRYLEEALTHRSAINEALCRAGSDNERLEFFGDSVLSFLISLRLIKEFPALREGELSRLRSALVDEASLAELAVAIDLGSFLTLGKGEEKGGGRGKKSILSDAFEALIAAIYLDGGVEPTNRFVECLFSPLIERLATGVYFKDCKTEFQERVQALFGSTPIYDLIDTQGPPHDRRFFVEVRVGSKVFGKGSGRSKKEAEQAAAAEALANPEATPVKN